MTVEVGDIDMATNLADMTVEIGPARAKVLRSGSGEPLVYLSGAFGYQGWPPFLEQLAQSFTVYAPVHPGFSELDGLERIDDILDLTLYHFDLLDALGLESAHLVGHFFGAMIAAEIAAICPHRVNRLVLASPAGLWLDGSPGVDYFATPMDELRSILFRDPDSDIATSNMPDPETDEERGRRAVDRLRSLSTVGKFLWPLPDKGLKKRLYRIKASTLVVVADGDQIVPPAYGDEMTRLIPGSRLEVVRSVGHLFILERPDEFARLVTGFLT